MDKTKKQIKPMECPVCHKFYFTKLEEWEIKAGETPNEQFCFRCGWHYDLEQLSDPDLKNQSNEMSLNEYRTWYKQKRKESKKWDYFEEHIPDPIPTKCPICGEYTFKNEQDFDICPICGWENNGFELTPDESTGPYSMTFAERKAWFLEKRKQNPTFKASDNDWADSGKLKEPRKDWDR